MAQSQEDSVYLAKLAEQAERLLGSRHLPLRALCRPLLSKYTYRALFTHPHSVLTHSHVDGPISRRHCLPH